MTKIMMLTYGQFVRPSVASGTARLVTELSKLEGVEMFFVFPYNKYGIIPIDNSKIKVENFVEYRLRDPRNILSLYRIRNIIKKHKPDILHIQVGHAWLSFLLPFIDTKIVLTIHDATPHSGEEKLQTIFSTKASINYSQAVIVHGKQQKESLKMTYNLEDSKVFINSWGSTIIDDSKRPNLVFYPEIFDYR